MWHKTFDSKIEYAIIATYSDIPNKRLPAGANAAAPVERRPAGQTAPRPKTAAYCYSCLGVFCLKLSATV